VLLIGVCALIGVMAWRRKHDQLVSERTARGVSLDPYASASEFAPPYQTGSSFGNAASAAFSVPYGMLQFNFFYEPTKLKKTQKKISR